MKSSGVRRLVYCVHVSLGVAAAAALANCGGGERPSAAIDNPLDAGRDSGPAGSITITGYDVAKGILFGDEGLVNCGTQATDQAITIKNPTPDIVNYTAKLTAGADKYKVNPSTGGVPAKGQASIQILPNPIPQESDTAPDLYAGTLEVAFATGGPPTVIRLHQTARGAIIKSTVLNNTIDFGSVKVNTNGTQLVSLTNSGNLEVTADFQLGTPVFKVDGASLGSAKLSGGTTASKTITFGPTELLPYTDTLALSFNGSAVQCRPAPASINLKGTGTSSVGVTPGTVNFGDVSCGTTAPFQTVKISSTIDMIFNPTLGDGDQSRFTLANNATSAPVVLGDPISLAANVDYIMRIVPKTVPIPSVVTANALGDILTITTNAPLDQPHKIDLQETAKGAIFTLNPAQMNVTGNLGQQIGTNFSLVNAGNASGAYSISVTNDPQAPSAFNATLTTGTASVGNTNGIVNMKMPTASNITLNGTLAVSAPSTVLCADLPPAMLLSAKGSGTSITTVPASPGGELNFGLVNCGGTAAAHQTINITSIVDTTITPNLAAGGSSPYTLENDAAPGTPLTLSNPITLNANVPYVLRVVPKPVPIPTPVAADTLYPGGLSDNLTLTSPVDPVKTIHLKQTAQGAIFAFNPPSISASGNVTLSNTGNASGAYTIAGTGGTSSPSTGTAGIGANVVLAITKSGGGTLTIDSPTTVHCSDFPTLTINP
jgi:hypothetical protein